MLWVVATIVAAALCCCCCGVCAWRLRKYQQQQPLGFKSKISTVTGKYYPEIEALRFNFYPAVDGQRSDTLLVSFAGAALQVGGFPKQEFRKSLAAFNCDQVYCMDPQQSFYLDAPRQCHGKRWEGYTALETRLRDECRHYRSVVFIGCSMGGSAVVLFSHLATVALAFNPLVDLDVEKARPRFFFWLRNKFIPAKVRSDFKRNIHNNIGLNRRRGCRVVVHYSALREDMRHIDTLPTDKDTGCEFVFHKECPHHNTAQFLKRRGQLAGVIGGAVRWASDHPDMHHGVSPAHINAVLDSKESSEAKPDTMSATLL